MKNIFSTLLFIVSLAFSTSIKYYASPVAKYQQVHKAQPHLIDKHKKNSLFRTNIDTTVIWSENFDYSSDQLLWLFDKGWEHTEQNSSSLPHSMLSPNNSTTQSVSEETYETYTLFSPIIELPNIAFYESMYFNFNIKADMCGNCDNDDFLNDYYQMDIQVGEDVSFWHISDDDAWNNGSSYWCGLDEIEGYKDHWLQFIDTDKISIPSDDVSMTVRMKWEIEDTQGAATTNVSEGWIDGWDAVNVRISIDGGSTWEILIGDDPYDFYSGYGWVYNGEKSGEDGTHSLASGWSGSKDWHLVSFDLNSYTGQDVIIRFAFGSDPAYSTWSDNGSKDGDPLQELTGVFIDDIIVASSDSVLFNADNEDEQNDILTTSSFSWTFQENYESCISNGYYLDNIFSSLEQYCRYFYLFIDYNSKWCFDDINENGIWDQEEPEISVSDKGACEVAGGIFDMSPGSDGWESYWQFNPAISDYGLDITPLSGKEIKFRFLSYYDDIDDSNEGEGLYLDDFSIFKVAEIISDPVDFSVESVNGTIKLSWYDMNLSGDSLFIFDNDEAGIFSSFVVDSCIDNCLAFAGTPFPAWLGESAVSKIEIYNLDNDPGAAITINAYTVSDGNSITEPVFSIDQSLDIEGWNEFDVNWQFTNMFVLSHSFTNEISAAFDNSVPTLGLWYLSGNEGWQLSKSEDQYTLGVWGIRAYVNYSGIDVTYNIYRNGAQLASNLTSGSFIDEGVENNITYEYILDVVFENGAIAKDTLSITPIPLTIYELPAYDDGSFESELVLQDDDYSAVRFSAGSGDEDIFHFTWYQFGSGGHFKLIAWEDNNGTPGDEIDGLILNSQNYPKVSEWNSVSLPNQYITVSGDFWIGIKGLSLTRPIGIDTTSTSGNSFTRIGENGEWVPVVKGNLAYRVSLDSNPLSIVNSIIPIEFGLNEIYPNPFNPIANIQFAISEFAQVRLSIYDLNGRLVNILLDDILNPGNYTSVWNGADGNGYKVSSGIYLVVLDAEGKNIQTRKLVLLK